MPKRILVVWLLVIVGITIGYTAWGRTLVQEAIEGTAPAWFQRVVEVVYPRLVVEKYRFETAFFLRKADQVVLRFGLVNLLLIAGLWLYKQKASFRDRIASFWDRSVPTDRTRTLRVLFYATVVFFSYEWYEELRALHKAVAFYKPLPVLRLLHLSFPPPWLLALFCGSLLLGCLTSILNFRPVLSAILVAALFILLQAWLFSFEKMDHTYALLTYVALATPFLLLEQRKAQQIHASQQAGWPLWLIQLMIGLVYGQSGLEKLLVGGLEWLHPDTFRNYIYLHQAPVGLQIARSDFLCALLPLLALLFELGFITIVFKPRWRWLFLPLGVLFHAGTYLLLDVGWYFNGWIATYIFFIPWGKKGKSEDDELAQKMHT